MTLDAALVARLVCPRTRTPLRQEGDWLVSEEAGLAYPIRDGVPVLLAEAAERIPGEHPAGDRGRVT